MAQRKKLALIFLLSALFVACIVALFKINSKDDPIETTQQEEDKPTFSFFVAGHTYGKAGKNNKGLHPPFVEMFDKLNNIDPLEFGVLTGDIVYQSTTEDWNEVDRDLAQLKVPIYFAVGNHDVLDRELFSQRYGKTYYSFRKENNLFLILDPNLDKWSISGDQLNFFRKEVKAVKPDDNIFIFSHQVIWWEPDNDFSNISINSESGRKDNPNFWSELAPLFTKLENPIYMFAGDVGAFSPGENKSLYFGRYENIQFIASGMGGGIHDNIVLVDIFPDKPEIKIIELNDPKKGETTPLEDYWTGSAD